MVFSSSDGVPILVRLVSQRLLQVSAGQTLPGRVQEELDREGIYQKSGSCLEPVRDVRLIDRLREKRNNAKSSGRFLNTIRFIGELFLSNVLAEKAMHCCIRRLLQNGEGPSLKSSVSSSSSSSRTWRGSRPGRGWNPTITSWNSSQRKGRGHQGSPFC
ncbi:unnamed protein product [Pleuronectes platessa]|uniref:MIF4G domain-containing protein n=1 Tax=Pleuronectes platessa TaxID=8262 RepID=A0A9N7TSM3_PLEPL|nr:unnamed protein product [Pleuronectes platessa]